MSRCYALVYLRIGSTDVDVLRLLSILGEMERVGTTTREMERHLLRNDAVFPPLLAAGKWCKTAKPPCFTQSGLSRALFPRSVGTKTRCSPAKQLIFLSSSN